MNFLRKIVPCKEKFCYEKENNPLSCKDCERYKPRIPIPKLYPVVLHYEYLAFERND